MKTIDILSLMKEDDLGKWAVWIDGVLYDHSTKLDKITTSRQGREEVITDSLRELRAVLEKNFFDRLDERLRELRK